VDVFEDQALRLDEKPAEELLAAAKEFYRRSEFPKSCRWLREVVAGEPGQSEAHYWLGAALVRRRRYREAIRSLLEAARFGFDRPDVQLRLGEVYQAQSQRKLDPEAERRDRRNLAVDAFARAIDMAQTMPFIDGSVAEAHLGAARVEAGRGRPDDALAHLEAALRAAPDVAAVHHDAQQELQKLLVGRADLDVRFAWLRSIVHRARRPEPYLALAGTYAALARPDAAFGEYLWAVWRYTKLRDAGHSKGLELPSIDWEQTALSDAPAALAKRERLLRRRPPPLVEAALGFGLFAYGPVASGIAALTRALERAPADPSIYHLARNAIREGQDPEAEQELLDALGAVVRRLDDAAAWTEWGYLLAARGNANEAGEAFEKGRHAEDGYVAWARSFVRRDPEQALVKLARAVDLAERADRLGAWLALSVRAIAGTIVQIRSDSDGRLAALIDRIESNLLPTTSPPGLISWGRALARLERPREGLARLRQALTASAPEDKFWQDFTFSAFDRACGSDPVLRDALTRAVTESSNPGAHAALTQALIQAGRWIEAERLCLAWNKLAPEDEAPYRHIGQIYSEQRRFEKAVAAYERAVERVPNNTSVYTNYLDALREMDKEGGAIGALVAVAHQWKDGVDERRPDWSEIERKHDRISRKVLRLVKQFKQQADYAADVMPRLAEELSRYGLHDQAAQLFEEYHDQYPENFASHYNWGFTLKRLGDPIAALRQLRRAIKDNTKWGWPQVERANCLVALGRLKWASCWFERALSSGTMFDGDKQANQAARINALSTWAEALSKVGDLEQALARADQACGIDEDDYWALFCKGHVFADIGAYEQANVYYDRACQADRTTPHAYHNLIGVLESQGLYRAAHGQRNLTLRVYAETLETRLKERDPYLFRFHAALCEQVKEEKRAEDLLRMARLLDPGNPEHEVALAAFYFSRDTADAAVARSRIGEGQEAQPLRTPAQLKALEHYRRAEAGLKRRLGFARTADTLLTLADLYMAAGEFEKARLALEEAARREPVSWRAYKAVGECHLKLGDANAATRSLERALRLAPEDLDAQSLAAQAYRRAEKLDEAEEAYRRVLRVAATHVDARVGLGELYLDMAERRADQKDSTVLAELYAKATSELQRAVDLFDSNDAPLTIASRKSSILYLLGYAQVKLHQTALLPRDKELLNAAAGNFESSDRAHFKACGEHHLKALRALDRLVSDRRGPIQSWAELYGGSIVVCVAIGLFLLAQAGVIWGRPVHRELLTLSPRTFATVAVMGVPQEVITKARPLESVSFRNGEVAAARLKELAGADAFGKYGGQIMAAAERSEAEVTWESVDLASYLTLTFGSLLMLIAGAYLPQLTSLKLAGVQLEKASAERVETRTTITISR
jgi:tetratricopeptide (TPR) repeat protein